MGSYGRNFEFRVPPVHGQRGGRYILPADADADLPIGVPVVVPDGAEGDEALTGAIPVELATGAQAPVKGQCGLLLYEHAPAAYAGFDPALTTYSDIDTVPRGKLVQVISGDMVKVVFRNTEDRVFLQSRAYTGRIMVAGMGATPTLAVGDFLTPGTGDDDAGYWAETGSAANAWLVVERVDAARQEVEARFAF
jgi:hypothetical protein